MIEELQRFIAVAHEGNLTRTAEKIFITQSALTQSIHRLEKNFQTKLFFQKGKQLQLTTDGKSLVIIGEKILQLWTNAHDPKMREVQIPIYSLGVFDNAALRLGTFFRNNMRTKNYNLELTIDASGRLFNQLQLGTLDAAVCITNRTYQLPKHLTLIHTYSEKLIPVSSKVFVKPFTHVPFILYNRGSNTRAQIDELFMKHNMQPEIYAESTSVTFMRELAVLGSGIAILPENLVRDDLKNGKLKLQKISIAFQREYGLFTQKQIGTKNVFIEELQKALETTSS